LIFVYEGFEVMNIQLLSPIALVMLPLLASIAILCPLFPNNEVKIRRFAKGFGCLLFIYSLLFVVFFDNSVKGYQFVQSYEWIKPLGINFSFGIDGLSLIMVILTTFLVLMALIASKSNITKSHKLYYSLIFLLTTAILGVFTSKDLFLFFLFWEIELIPMFFLISIWGSGRKEYSATKFILYTFFGSIFMLLSILAVYYQNWLQTGVLTFDHTTLSMLNNHTYPLWFGILAFLGFFIGFAVKLPIVPFHTWLPDAHVDASTPTSMLLAGILLKMGGYGLIRMNLQLLPEFTQYFASMLVVLGVVNLIYGAFVALAQTDLKKLVAYSSISHMGIVLIGLGALNPVGLTGAIFQMFAHGVISAGLFMVAGVVYLRTHTRDMLQFGGLAKVMPRLSYFAMLIALASLGLPLLIGFPAETLSFYGAFIKQTESFSTQILVIIGAFSIILTAGYLLWMLQKVFFGTMFEKWNKVRDITPHETVILVSITAVIIIFGIFPTGLTNLFQTTVNSILAVI
jgi:NADH-quinone oxidoreductase subunit M